jgi:hypothetical protein
MLLPPQIAIWGIFLPRSHHFAKLSVPRPTSEVENYALFMSVSLGDICLREWGEFIAHLVFSMNGLMHQHPNMASKTRHKFIAETYVNWYKNYPWIQLYLKLTVFIYVQYSLLLKKSTNVLIVLKFALYKLLFLGVILLLKGKIGLTMSEKEIPDFLY